MKTAATKEILDFLILKFDIDDSQIVNFWDADNCAFGLNNQDKSILIYISTFNKEDNNYFLQIEYTNGESQTFENISIEDLENRLRSILKKTM